MTIVGASTASPLPSPAQRSPWHSPVPYLFGGLAAMLGLIAFALLVLACSYWKFSSHGGDGERDLEAGEGNGSEGSEAATVKPPPVLEEKYLVIMAGQEKPTFLATPMSSRASSFGSKSTSSTSSDTTVTSEEDNEEKKQQTNCGQIEIGTVEAHQAPDQFN
ncbi:GLUTAMINE DUMPER 2-like [Olea europaea subsp. europaea]|uniref:GLUTAMINE DUMPER 2-like n=1 Tax=Olea europaea subsp. europaea TaxID=158383 RepID=A0A8S0SFX1_OLEEU|nr:GLUTAMINE DUMPER 2-like [Olea europaea subsp. europaea]